MGKFDEQAFLSNFNKRPEIAFQQLMNEFRDQIFLFCRRATKGRMDAEDLAQEVFIRAWKGLSRFRGESSVSTWLYRIAWNVCATHLDKKGRAPDFAIYSEQESGEDRPVGHVHLGASNPDVKDFENKQYLEECFKALPESHRMVLSLYYLQERNYEEISSITSWPMGTVKATLHRAKAKLREEVTRERDSF